MDSHQSYVPSFTNSSAVVECESQSSDSGNRSSGNFCSEVASQKKEMIGRNLDGSIGVLEVYIHQARDIHNICIYHKQDVYAKLCLTSDPEITVSTQIINGGGKNPVFNENLQLNVRTIDSSLKCEIWMLSRVKNYLEDQLLGFALVPLSEIVVANARLMQEFSLSSTDLFHSPAGFVKLSLSYCGSAPEVLAAAAPLLRGNHGTMVDVEADNSVQSEYIKIEFPDPKIVNEDQLMVSEYFGLPCTNLDSQTTESLVTSDNDNHLNSKIGIHDGKSLSADSLDSLEVLKGDTPPSSVSTNGSPAPVTASPQSVSDPPLTLESPSFDQPSSQKEKSADVAEGEKSDSSSGPSNSNAFVQSILNIKLPEQPVVQHDIVDMYMKSMQQFTESLAKMKLPGDTENGSNDSENANSSSDKKVQPPKGSSRVFYGSRAFF